nr:YHYH domain-containing protein [Bacillus infantis]
MFPIEATAHSGRTDSYGGHNKTANGTYHCHSGQCLIDARNTAYDEYFPHGQEDGLLKNDQSEDIEQWLNENLDSDVAEYIVPYALEAYQDGYKSTYVPTFWEKNKWYVGGLSVVLLLGARKAKKALRNA